MSSALKYISTCQNSDGGHSYQPGSGSSNFARTAAGLVSMLSAGETDQKRIKKAQDYLFSGGRLYSDGGHRWYARYYTSIAMWKSGDERWGRFYKDLCKKLTAEQSAAGGWSSSGYGEAYSTSIACISLLIPNDLIPAYSR